LCPDSNNALFCLGTNLQVLSLRKLSRKPSAEELLIAGRITPAKKIVKYCTVKVEKIN
jgi:hypothetical protein